MLRNQVGPTHSSEIRVAIRDATPARMMVTLVSFPPVPPPAAPSGMMAKGCGYYLLR